MATATKTTGFRLACPKYGDAEGLTVRTHDLSLECQACSETIEREDLEAIIADAQRLLRWLDLAAEA